ncbi:MAG: hypothetical protein M1824_000127 [Vezdaea acicularis]|nr:MAG: hypothetical protein M1824_000127 [Vezdaea acicularis]
MARLNLSLLSALFLFLGLLPTIYAETITFTGTFIPPPDSPTITHETLNFNIDVGGNLVIVDPGASLAKSLKVGLIPKTIHVPTIKETASNGDITLTGTYTSPGTHRSRLSKRQAPTNVDFTLGEGLEVVYVNGLEEGFNLNLTPYHGYSGTLAIFEEDPGKAKRADSVYVGVQLALIVDLDLDANF